MHLQASSAVDESLLLAGLRELYRALRERARAAEAETARHIYSETMRMVEQVIEERGDRRRACEALSAEIARQVVAALDQRELEQVGRR